MLFRRMIRAIALAVGLTPQLPAAGAVLSESSQPYCRWELSGPIATGDLAVLRDLTQDFHPDGAVGDWQARICLDSPGGAFTEAVAIAEFLVRRGIGTVVGDGRQCLAACAFLFMGGAAHGVEMAGFNRLLHIHGVLGFQAPTAEARAAPNLAVTASFGELLATAAILMTSGLNPRIGRPVVPQSLVALAFRYAGDAFLYVDTVDEARRWDIALITPGLPDSWDLSWSSTPSRRIVLDKAAAQRACTTALAWTAASPARPEYPTDLSGELRDGLFSNGEAFVEYYFDMTRFHGAKFCHLRVGKDENYFICAVDEDIGAFLGLNCTPSENSLNALLDPWALIDPSTKLWALEQGAAFSPDDLLRSFTSFWWHEGTIVGFEKALSERILYRLYGPAGADIAAGTALAYLTTEDGTAYSGLAEIETRCGRHGIELEGSVSADGRRIVLDGTDPAFDAECRYMGQGAPRRMTFDLIASVRDARLIEKLDAAIRRLGEVPPPGN